MLRFKLCILLIINCCVLNAQDHLYNKIWMLGGRCGLDFSSGVPVAIPGKMEQLEGLASACGPDGKLLLYTDGSSVWNSMHEVMPNGFNMAPYYNNQLPKPTESTTQAAVIVPMPDSSKYYIFSLTQAFGSHLFYSIVNMDLNGCSGDVEPDRKAILLDADNLSEKMVAVRGDNCNIWLIVHDMTRSLFKSYEITAAGLNPVPVISQSGLDPFSDPTIPNSGDIYTTGAMKISNDRKSLALVNRSGTNVELHRFDPLTGKVSNGQELYREQGGGYGICFSPDDSKLYVTYSISRQLLQFDLSLANLADIKNSRTVITTFVNSFELGDIALAPDNKLYFSSYSTSMLPVINFPNLPGVACQFVHTKFSHQGIGPRFGLPAAPQVLQSKDTLYSSRVVKLNGCFDGLTTLIVATGRDHIWENGSTCKTRVVDKSGVYVVKYTGSSCIYHVDTFIVPDIPVPVFPEKCTSTSNAAWFTTVQGDTTRWNYTWSTEGNVVLRTHSGRTGDTLRNIPTGNYSVSLESSSGCNTTVSFKIAAIPSIVMSSDKDTVCIGEQIISDPQYSEPASSYTWDFGDGTSDNTATPAKVYSRAGTYQVRHAIVSNEGCRSAPFNKWITVNRQPMVNAGTDITMIAGDPPAILKAEAEAGSILLWSPAAYLSDAHILQPTVISQESNLYYLTVTDKNGCSNYDSVKVTILLKIAIPNAFSPNNDGINDKWVIPGLNGYSAAKVSVFNRWGQVVYESTGYNIPWDGRRLGKELPAGTFYYLIDLKSPVRKGIIKGSVTILR